MEQHPVSNLHNKEMYTFGLNNLGANLTSEGKGSVTRSTFPDYQMFFTWLSLEPFLSMKKLQSMLSYTAHFSPFVLVASDKCVEAILCYLGRVFTLTDAQVHEEKVSYERQQRAYKLKWGYTNQYCIKQLGLI